MVISLFSGAESCLFCGTVNVALILGGFGETQGLDIHDRHALEVQSSRRLLPIDLHLQFIEMLRLQSAVEADDGCVPVGRFFNS
jgi:hypothetical protein